MSSSSSSGSETIDFYSDITQNGVDGGDDEKPMSWKTRIWLAIVVVAIIVLILGITLWQMESNNIISYTNPISDTAEWLSKGLMIAGGAGIFLLVLAPIGYGIYTANKPKTTNPLVINK